MDFKEIASTYFCYETDLFVTKLLTAFDYFHHKELHVNVIGHVLYQGICQTFLTVYTSQFQREGGL